MFFIKIFKTSFMFVFLSKYLFKYVVSYLDIFGDDLILIPIPITTKLLMYSIKIPLTFFSSINISFGHFIFDIIFKSCKVKQIATAI